MRFVYSGRYQWDIDEINENDIKLDLCDSCGRKQLVMVAPDPFLAEIFPGDYNPPARWCCSCYATRSDEI